MGYLVSNNKVIINGDKGIYDKKINSAEVKYGRNAADNYKSYVSDLANKPKCPPIQFAYQYIPKGQYSMQALMGNAYEELGKKTEVSVEELNHKFDEANKKISELNQKILTVNPNANVVGFNFSADALDLNDDGVINIAEYATSSMVADMLDKDTSECKKENLDGVITNVGEDASLVLYQKSNAQSSKILFSQIYQYFNLNKEMKTFVQNPNNTI